MTEAQQSALQEIQRLLAVNFDAWVLSTRDTSDGNQAQINSFWNGSLDSVVGLAAITQTRLHRVVIETTGPAEPFTKGP